MLPFVCFCFDHASGPNLTDPEPPLCCEGAAGGLGGKKGGGKSDVCPAVALQCGKGGMPCNATGRLRAQRNIHICMSTIGTVCVCAGGASQPASPACIASSLCCPFLVRRQSPFPPSPYPVLTSATPSFPFPPQALLIVHGSSPHPPHPPLSTLHTLKKAQDSVTPYNHRQAPRQHPPPSSNQIASSASCKRAGRTCARAATSCAGRCPMRPAG